MSRTLLAALLLLAASGCLSQPPGAGTAMPVADPAEGPPGGGPEGDPLVPGCMAAQACDDGDPFALELSYEGCLWDQVHAEVSATQVAPLLPEGFAPRSFVEVAVDRPDAARSAAVYFTVFDCAKAQLGGAELPGGLRWALAFALVEAAPGLGGGSQFDTYLLDLLASNATSPAAVAHWRRLGLPVTEADIAVTPAGGGNAALHDVQVDVGGALRYRVAGAQHENGVVVTRITRLPQHGLHLPEGGDRTVWFHDSSGGDEPDVVQPQSLLVQGGPLASLAPSPALVLSGDGELAWQVSGTWSYGHG